MSTFKQVHMKFWQNDFVLGLTAEERYFYIYLIINSMTNQCGIFKFNRRVAELETGYTAEQIEKFLGKFQDYGKVVISTTTTEIMLVNWFKHNFKSNKKTIILINKELKDVKDKELLKKLYDSCSNRQYPVAEIFNGIILPGVEIKGDEQQVKTLSEAVLETQEEVSTCTEHQEETTRVTTTSEQSSLAEELSNTESFKLNSFLMGGFVKVGNGANGEGEIEVEVGGVLDDYEEEENEEIEGGTIIASWGFTNEDTSVSFREGCSDNFVTARSTA